MDLGSILKEGVEVLKRNYTLAVPTVVATFITALFALVFLKSQEQTGALAAMGLASMVLNYFSQGVTVAMAGEALEKGRVSSRKALEATSAFFFPFLVAAVAVTALVSLGFMLLIIPGFAAMLLLMFVFPAIAVRSLRPLAAIKESYRVVRANLGDSIIVFAVLVGMVIVIALVNMALNAIPVIGDFISLLINGAFGGFSAVVVLRAYLVLSARGRQTA
ncbi:MAG: hypothetical protein PVJ36_07640 [Nitrospirota bacterium]|jgi:hypothetical protein